MTELYRQPAPNPKALGPILEALTQALPALEKLVNVSQGSYGTDLSSLSSDFASPVVQEQLSSKTLMFVNFINGKSRLMSTKEIEEIKPEDYALYLNAASGMVGVNLPEQEPQIQTVQDAGLDGVQDILGVMMEYPHLNFGNVSVGAFLPHRQDMTPDAFRKAVAKIRYAIQNGSENGPLLLHFDRSHHSISDSGHAWRISMQEGNICFIRFLHPSERFRLKRRP